MRKIDGKFHIEGERIVGVNGKEIPEDEPLFLLRARDYLALDRLREYRQAARQDGCTDYHLQGIDRAIFEFTEFKAQHPERMKQPGISLRKW